MRDAVLIAGAAAVLAVGFVLAAGSGGPDGSATSAGTTTAQETAAPAATAPPASTAAPAATPAAPKLPTVVFADGAPRGGVQTLTFRKGDEVRFRVRSDVADEIHVHGFDEKAEIAAGGTVTFAFTARFDGVYEVEMEGSGTQLASLEIRP